MSKQLQPGTYVEDVEHMYTHPDGRQVIVSSHKVREEDYAAHNIFVEALGGIAERARISRIQATLAGLKNVYGMRLDEKTLESRAELIMRYKDVRPIWVREKNTHTWLRFKSCLDFNAPNMHARLLDDGNNIHLYDPDKYHFCTKAERVQWIMESRLDKQKSGIEELRVKARSLESHARYLDRRANELEDENGRVYRLFRKLSKEIGLEERRRGGHGAATAVKEDKNAR